jgi:pyrimidine-nucleoside phosphorylase
MHILPQEIIRKKRLGESLSPKEIQNFFMGHLKGEVADYQVTAMLMAIMFQRMTATETAALTECMRDSGDIMTWPKFEKKNVVDKHSTGGIGDKTSLLLAPLCILEGLKVPMIAGRGLGHTGGTIDKLESIPKMNLYLSKEQAERQLEQLGGFIIGQTDRIAPLDKKLYAFRDVTDCVESISLITASILSKKLAEGIGGLVMDVKYGSGAFMRAPSDAQALAESIRSVATATGVKVTCMLTDMNSPLGSTAGNALELEECVQILRGNKSYTSTIELTHQLAKEMILLARPNESEDDIKTRLDAHLTSGRAYDLFVKIVAAQGGDTRVIEDLGKLPKARHVIPLLTPTEGFITSIDCRAIGLEVIKLGGGRLRATDAINHAVGLSELKRVGDRISKNEPLALIHCDDLELGQNVSNALRRAIIVGDEAHPNPLVWKTLR